MFRTALSSERSGFTGQAGRGKSREAVHVPLRIQGDVPRGAAHHRIVGLRRKRHHDALQVKLQTCKKTEPFPAPGPSRCDGGGAGSTEAARWDNSIRLNAGWRVQAREAALANSPITDEGESVLIFYHLSIKFYHFIATLSLSL